MNLNKVFIVGRLAADPEIRSMPSGQPVANIRVATNRVWNDQSGNKQEQVEFHTIVAFGGLADIISKYLKKGQMALFEGRLQTRSWQGQDGQKKYRTEIIADNMQLGPKAMGTTTGYNQSSPSTPQAASDSFQNSITPKQQPAQDITEEEIPVINEDAPITSNPITESDAVEEREIDLKDIPF